MMISNQIGLLCNADSRPSLLGSADFTMAAKQDGTIQLAGHVGAFATLPGGKIRKLVKKGEASFYSGLADRHLDSAIAPYIPKFFGLEEHEGNRILFSTSALKTLIFPICMPLPPFLDSCSLVMLFYRVYCD